MAVFNCFFVPLNVAFEPSSLDNWVFINFQYMTDLVFFIDIFIMFRTTFINDRGEEEFDSYKIAFNYLKGSLMIDVVATIPFDEMI